MDAALRNTAHGHNLESISRERIDRHPSYPPNLLISSPSTSSSCIVCSSFIMLVLFETAAGFALFKVLDEGKLREQDDLWKEFETPDKAQKMYFIYLTS